MWRLRFAKAAEADKPPMPEITMASHGPLSYRTRTADPHMVPGSDSKGLGCVDIHAEHTMAATRLMKEANRSTSLS